jgi:hypothetical protein
VVDGAELRCIKGETHARRRARARGAQAATRKCPNCVGSGRLLPQLRAVELPVDRGAGGFAYSDTVQILAGVRALSLFAHDRRCGFRTSSPAAMRVLGREIVSVIRGVGCRRAPPNIAFAQSPPGIGRKRPSLPGQLPGDRASAVPLQLPQMRPVGRKKKKRSRVRGRVRIPRYANEDFSDG